MRLWSGRLVTEAAAASPQAFTSPPAGHEELRPEDQCAHLFPPAGSVCRKITKDNVEMLRLKEKEKLTFVYQTVYNTGPVRMIRRSQRSGSISASCQKMLSLLVKVREYVLRVPSGMGAESVTSANQRQARANQKVQGSHLSGGASPREPPREALAGPPGRISVTQEQQLSNAASWCFSRAAGRRRPASPCPKTPPSLTA